MPLFGGQPKQPQADSEVLVSHCDRRQPIGGGNNVQYESKERNLEDERREGETIGRRERERI